jgi:hypothetical protein
MIVGRTANASLAVQPHTKDNSTKDTITKDNMPLQPKRKRAETRLPSVVFQEWADSVQGDAYMQSLCSDPRFGKDYVQTEFEKAIVWLEQKEKSEYASDRKQARKSDWGRFMYNWLMRNL